MTATEEGRNGGHLDSDDGLIDLDLATPAELGGAGGATNPERLFAAAWSACHVGAFRRVAAEEKVGFDGIETTAHVTLNNDATNGFYLTARLEVTIGGIGEETLQRLADAAHRTCPYSKAVTSNVPVEIVVHAK